MSKPKIHVMHILHRFTTGGLENGVVNIINQLPPSMFEHTIVCITDYDPIFAERLTVDGVSIISLNKPAGRGIRYLFALRKIIKDLQPNIIHSRGLAALFSQLSSLFLPVRRVHGEHGWDSAAAKHNKKYQRLRRFMGPMIDQFVVLSEEGMHFLCDDVGINPNKIELICNGVDTNKFVAVAKVDSPTVVITTVGRLVPVKNQQLLIQAFERLVHDLKFDNIELRIIGEGECRQHLTAQIIQRNLSKHCFLLGQMDNVHQQLVQADVFVLPSFAEGISNTILESMACGIPVVASDVGGNSQLVADGSSGAVFGSDNVTALVDALKRYLVAPELRVAHGDNARQRVLDKFSLNKMVAQYQQLYLKP